jgi:type 1 glutamine amidotransferase|tara:strand:+ start:2427 stop:3170 length:744 start_codon:yes stop_codon:yes gene_type:complete
MLSQLPAFKRPAVLVFNKTNGFRHEEAIPAADQTFSDLAAENGWDVFVTDDAEVHEPDALKGFQLVIWNNVSGDVLTLAQRASLRQWLESGGGWLGVHGSGGDLSYDWDWYVDTLIGAQFHGHTLDPQLQDAQLLMADSTQPLTSHIASPLLIPAEEWYAFASNPRNKGYEILLTLDKSSYVTKGEISPGWIDSMAGEHPQVWCHYQGKGRVFYSAIGHQPETYELPDYRELLNRAMLWAIASERLA